MNNIFLKNRAKFAKGVVYLNHGHSVLNLLPALHLLSVHPRGKRKDLLKGGEGFLEVWGFGQTETMPGPRQLFMLCSQFSTGKRPLRPRLTSQGP